MMNPTLIFAAIALLLFSLVRTGIHVDEARYLTVAWEMTLTGDCWVPHLNGEPYSHKPPLLFWATNLIWSMTGVHLWAARLILVLCTLLTALLLPPIARQLFPTQPTLGTLTQAFFLANLLVIGITLMYMFDTLMMFWVTLCWLIILYRHALKQTYPFALGAIMGLAILTKGPVIFVYVLPLLALTILLNQRVMDRRWIVDHVAAMGFAIAIGLFWALMAAHKGGQDYAEALLWKQTAGRMLKSFSHQRPWWFYLVLSPVFFIPWIFLPKFITGLIHHRSSLWQDSAVKLISLWILIVFGIFSFISCKQVQYLIPLLPLLAILAAHTYQQSLSLEWPQRQRYASIMVGSTLAIAAIVIYPLNRKIESRIQINDISSRFLTDPKRPFAFVHCYYHGEWGFAARRARVDHLTSPRDIDQWFQENPQGLALIYEHLDNIMDNIMPSKPIDPLKYRILYDVKTHRYHQRIIERNLIDISQLVGEIEFLHHGYLWSQYSPRSRGVLTIKHQIDQRDPQGHA